MLHFTPQDRQMLDHVTDVVGDRMHHEDGYTEQDTATVAKLDRLAKSVGAASGSAVVLTGEEILEADAQRHLAAVVRLELKHWVPGASQRLIYRAANALGLKQPYPTVDDHGPDPASHPLVPDWVAGMYLMRCATCCRLFPTSVEQTA
ncbi:hypothetical protein [Streptomyces phage phiSAJS1]|uniref:hypothetical protein n=1 Tax=Streptomyces phage phiSAJS1 TaxID=1755682 RepID=UPI00072054C2|nr:hypothetical protein AVT91_p39 [Streptomyces phage phiSAJS1]ALO79380.1 hypothetical protein [Streptomyces phage phiSAJS1]